MARSAVTGQLKMKDIFKFCNATPESRNYNEGEQVLAAQHVLLVGQMESDNESSIKIYGLVLKTSGLTSPPHEVKGTIIKEEKINRKKGTVSFELHLEQFTCSCKAGAGEQCKHIVAVLLYLYKYE